MIEEKNGTVQEDNIDEKLMSPFTDGYRPSTPPAQFYNADGTPQFYILRDLQVMLTHPHVGMTLEYFKSGIAGAEFEGTCNNEEAGKFAIDQVRRFWDRGMPKLQNAYDWGWCGGENMYEESNGRLEWEDLADFHPRDTFLLTQSHTPVGIRVKNIPSGPVDLWFADRDIPAKGLWYAHNAKFGTKHGQSQCHLAWRPWRRLASMDAAETVTDTAIYRFGFSGPVMRYPSESYKQPTTGAGGGPPLPLGTQYQYARDAARQFCEWAKAGASVALPSDKYPAEKGGDFKWILDWPDHTINVDGLLNYVQYLKKEISYGIGVPPELIEASETGSGYSGRAIPMEAFYMCQQKIADCLARLFVQQVLKPLIWRNYGEGVVFDIKVKNLLQTKKMAQMGQDPSKQERPGFPGMQTQSGGGQVAFSLAAAKAKILKFARMPESERLKAGYNGLRLLTMALAG